MINLREIFKIAILSNASNMILGHNHPNGDHDPLEGEEEMAKRVKK